MLRLPPQILLVGAVLLAGLLGLEWFAGDEAPLAVMAQAEEVAPAAVPKETEAAVAPLARPVALAWGEDAKRLLVANRDAGTISVIDLPAGRVLREMPVGAQPANLAMLPGRRSLMTLHPAANELRLWRVGADFEELTLLRTLALPQHPVEICLAADGERAFVSCLWGKTVVELRFSGEAATTEVAIARTLALPFSPRLLLEIPEEQRLLVADGFRGNIAVVELAGFQQERIVPIPGHNVRGLARLPGRREFVITHQILNQLAETSHDGVFWGIVMTNNLRIIPFENVLTAGREPLQDGHIHFLGDPRAGAGDPSDLAVTPDRTLIVPLGGVDEVAIGMHLDHSFDRTPSSRRPTAVLADARGEFAYIANMFSDSVTVLKVANRKVVSQIALRPESREPTVTEQGEALFYDARLSLDGWYSCHSCHTDGHTIGMLNDNLGDEGFGAPKRIPSLLGTGETGPWLWSGRRETLPEQIRKSIHTTMQGEEPKDDQVAALTEFVRHIAPPPASSSDADREQRGKLLFSRLGCMECHVPPAYTSAKTYDVGLVDQRGRTRFNPPSLRGVRLRGPYFHDNRAATLQDAFRVVRHKVPEGLSDEEISDLIGFLESL